MKILFLSRWFPWPTTNGSKLRIYNLLRGMADQHEITLLSFADHPSPDPKSPELNKICKQIQVVEWKPYQPGSRKAQMGLLSTLPRSIYDTFSLEMAQRIKTLNSEDGFDIVIASEIETACYREYFRDLPALFEDVEIGVPYDKFIFAPTLLHRIRSGLTWIKLKRYLHQLLPTYQACTVVSEKEKALLSQSIPDYQSIHVIPNCVDFKDYHQNDDPQPNTLIFTGSFQYNVNYEGISWFLNEVFPRILLKVPETRLTITGDHMNRPVSQNVNVTLTGFVDDVRPMIARSWVSLVPILHGGGTRLKILEAMALRTPVVSTRKGAEGLDVQNGVDLLIADEPQDFANMVVRLLKEPELHHRLAENANKLVATNYNWSIVIPKVLNLIGEVAHP
jgi:glycosyltransferase involved in cell wall biosynthesis